MVMSGEIEVLSAVVEEDEEGYEDGDEFVGASGGAAGMEDVEVQMLKNAPSAPPAFVHPSSNNNNNNNGMHTHIQPRPSTHAIIPTTATSSTPPSAVSMSFDNPALAALYDPAPPFPTQQQQYQPQQTMDPTDKWTAQLFSAAQMQQQLQSQRAVFANITTVTPAPAFNDADFFATFQRQQQLLALHQHMYGDAVGAASWGVG
jgi:hypothetical protein